jgi:hypothetical protein
VIVVAAVLLPAVAVATGISIGIGTALAIGAVAGAVAGAAGSAAIRGKVDVKTALWSSGGAAVGAAVVGLSVAAASAGGVCAAVCNRGSGDATSSMAKYADGMSRGGVTQSTTRVPSSLSPGAYRVPDIYGNGIIGEVKNVQYQSWSSQLRDYSAISQRDGMDFILRINSDARLSGPLMQASEGGMISIERY